MGALSSKPPSEPLEQQRLILNKAPEPSSSKTAKRRFQDVLEEGHAAAGITIFIAVSVGLLLGFTLPTDRSIPGKRLQ
jgi:hypothetical protein